MKKQQLQRILDALETSFETALAFGGENPFNLDDKAAIQEIIDEVKAEIAKPESEPDAWMLKTGHGIQFVEKKPECYLDKWKALYVGPPEREPLSENQLLEIYKTTFLANVNVNVKISQKSAECYAFARAVEAAHGITTAQPAQE